MIAQFDDTMWDLWLSRLYLPAIAVADEIELFSHINEKETVSSIAAFLHLEEKGLDALCTFLSSINLLTKNTDYISLTTMSSQYLIPSSPSYWGPALSRAKDSPEYSRILSTLQNKKKQLEISGKNVSTTWKEGEISYVEAIHFTKIMHSTIYCAAASAVNHGIFDKTMALLDVGAGSGSFITFFLRKYKNRTAGVFELPEVCKVTESYLSSEPFFSKITLHAGNFFNDTLPKGFDSILFSNIFHDWPRPVAQMLIEKSHQALPNKGKIFIHEMLLNEEKNGPKVPAAFNLLMHINHGSQQFSKIELIDYLEKTGFTDICVEKVHPFFSMIVATK